VKSIGYEGAGTLEFCSIPSGEFYFMEMNTRLQVEHPVTETITGLDLVELQLRVAAGEPLGLAQEAIKFSGHAIEVRLCSEDAGHDFMPQSVKWRCGRCRTASASNMRCNRARKFRRFYDSMIAKIISHGADRNEARGKLIGALEQTARSASPPTRDFCCPACAIQPLQRVRRPRLSSASIAMRLLAPRQDASVGGRTCGAAAVCHRSLRAEMAERPVAGSDVSRPRSFRARRQDPRYRDRA
jgi:geranyl-CoA carboxylase alpha subunit